MYMVQEIQTMQGGTVAVLPVASYENQNAAEAAYHTILAAAAQSSLPKHTAMMFTEEGFLMRRECYLHQATE